MTKTIAYLLIMTLVSSQTLAQVPGFSLPGSAANGSGAEFFVGRIEGKPLITVNLTSGVRVPGVYHIPIQTNLSQLVSYSGGLNENAAVGNIAIRSIGTDNKTDVTHYDWNHLVGRSEAFPILKDKDTINIDTKSNTLQTTALWIGVISGITSIILAGIVINNTRPR